MLPTLRRIHVLRKLWPGQSKRVTVHVAAHQQKAQGMLSQYLIDGVEGPEV